MPLPWNGGAVMGLCLILRLVQLARSLDMDIGERKHGIVMFPKSHKLLYQCHDVDPQEAK